MTRPQPNIRPELVDKLLDGVAFCFLLLCIAIPVYHYSSLPESIPIHFNFSGVSDKMGHKSFIWLLPFMSILLMASFIWLSKRPHKFNYVQKVTESNAQQLYRTATRMMRMTNLVIMLLFCYLTFAVVSVAQGQMEGLSGEIMITLVFVLWDQLR